MVADDTCRPCRENAQIPRSTSVDTEMTEAEPVAVVAEAGPIAMLNWANAELIHRS